MTESDAVTRSLRPTPGAEQPLSVLVVDDDALIRLHLQLALSNEGLRISEAASGQQALELASGQAFDIVLMDVRMPGMDGFAACERLKQLPGHGATPVVMLTGMEDQESIRRATQVGAIDYVTKPLSATVLAKRVRHIVQAQRNHAELDSQRASQNALLHAIPDTILRFDAEGILLASKFPEACPNLLRMRSAIGSGIREIFSGVPQFDPTQALQRALQGETTAVQIAWPEAEESVYEVRFVASAANDVMCILRDVSRQVRQQRRIEQLSLTDGQTGLANRACFLQMAQRQLDAAPDQALCMLQLSFVSYPSVSSSVGSKAADQLIRVLADTLVEASGARRQFDSSGAGNLPIIARTGEADFHLLLGNEGETLDALVRRVSQAVDQPIQVEQYEFRLPLRMGVATTEVASGDVDELFKMSGLAAQKASQQQSSEPLLYSPALQRESQRSLLLESALRRALAQGELELLYQPKVCAHHGRLKSLEALCRWSHPELGVISPAEFIPLAEESGLILPLGELVLERACQQIRQWRLAGHTEVSIAVNVSGHQLNQRQVDRQLFRLLERCDVPEDAIELEITESVLVEQDHVLGLLERIRARGVRIAIDDFGTGHSSLSMLKTFPIDILKIDRAFVSEIADERRAYSIVDTIIALGQALDLTLVAEGIETESQLNYLRARGCHLIQGYLTGRPMSAGDIERQFLQPQLAS